MEKSVNGNGAPPVAPITIKRLMRVVGGKNELLYFTTTDQYIGSIGFDMVNITMLGIMAQDFARFAAEQASGLTIVPPGALDQLGKVPGK